MRFNNTCHIFKTVSVMICMLLSPALALGDTTNIDEIPDIDRDLINRYDIKIEHNSQDILGVEVYKSSQKNVLMSFSDGVEVKHGKRKGDNATLFSQWPEDAEINGSPFLDYITNSTDHANSSSVRTSSGKLSVCWFSDEKIMYEVLESIAEKIFESRDYKNHCLNDDMASVYWSERERS